MSRNTRRAPGQWGTTQQLPSDRWRAFYRHDGRRITAPQTFDTKAAAQAWLAGEHADRSRGTWRDPQHGRIPLSDYARGWLDTRPNLSPRYRDLCERMLTRFVLPRVGAGPSSRGVELGTMDVADLTPAVVRTWYAAVVATTRESAAKRSQRAAADRPVHPARAWARSRGLDVPGSGRLPYAVLSAWQEAGAPVPAERVLAAGPDAGKSTAAQAYKTLRAILADAVTDALLTANPCQIKNAGTVKHAERKPATPAEVAQLAAHMPRDLSAAVTIAAWTGLRYGELFALARRHVDLEAGTVAVERALVTVPGQSLTFGATKTAKSRRTVNLPGFVADVLREHLAEHVAAANDALLFTMSGGAPVSNVRLSFVFRKARAVIDRDDLRWHDLRHTGATLAYRAGGSVADVQKRLGHTTMRAAQIYAHAADESDRVLADRLDALYAADSTAQHLRAV